MRWIVIVEKIIEDYVPGAGILNVNRPTRICGPGGSVWMWTTLLSSNDLALASRMFISATYATVRSEA